MAASRSGGGSAPRYAPSEPTLAKPWKELIDGATGNHYFWNPDTGVTQYHRPASSRHRHRHRHRHQNPTTSARGHGSVAEHEISGSGPHYAPEDPALPKPWKELIDGATGSHYFWNPDTNVTQYHRPAGCLSPRRQASSLDSHKSSKTSVRGHGSVEAYRQQHEITMTAHKATTATEKRNKRGRGVSPDLIPAARKRSGGSPRDWSALPNEIWRLVLAKLALEDYIRCASVCSWLRSIAWDLKQCSSLPRVPWLIECDKHSREGDLKLFDMASNKNYKVHLPELFDSFILGSSEGWLIVADKNTADLRLLNPFSREQIHLPPTTTFPGIVDYRLNSQGQVKQYYMQSEKEVTMHEPRYVVGYFEQATLVSSNCGYIVVVHHRSEPEPGIAFARSGDKVWTALQKLPNQLKSFMFFNDLLYTMDPYGKVFSFDFRNSGSPPSPLPVARVAPEDANGDTFLGILPESGELVIVRISYYYNIDYSYNIDDDVMSKTFRTFMLDHVTEKWVDMSSTLNGHSMFLTIGFMEEFFRNMVCISAKDFPGQIKGNCIYSVIIGPLQVWDNEDKKITRYHPTPEDSDGIRYIPLWISPVLTSLGGRGA